MIENLGAALDQYDTIDFSDNEIRKLDGFPFMNRVKSLMMNNNRIVRVAEGLELSLPNLNTLILTNNSLQVNKMKYFKLQLYDQLLVMLSLLLEC